MSKTNQLVTSILGFLAAFPLELINKWLTCISLMVSITAGVLYIINMIVKKMDKKD